MKKLKKAPESTVANNEMTIDVEGMMCEHCEKRVKETLEKINGISEAYADFNTGKVRLILNGTPDIKEIKREIKKAGYKLKQ